MTSTGYGDVHAKTVAEMLFAIVVMIAGKLMFGFVLGNIAFTLANDESQRVDYDQNLDSIKGTMEDQQVPTELQGKVVEYYDYIWMREKGHDVRQLFKDCPQYMLSDICLEVCKPMLDALPLFGGLEESFLRHVAQNIQQVRLKASYSWSVYGMRCDLQVLNVPDHFSENLGSMSVHVC